MKNWKEYYDAHLISLEESVTKIQSGDRVWMNASTQIPYPFLDLLADRKDELEDVTLFTNMLVQAPKMITDPVYKKHFHFISLFYGSVERAYRECVDLLSIPYSKVLPTMQEVYRINVMVIEVSPPDKDGYCNLGVQGCSYNPHLYKLPSVTTIIGVVNENMVIAKGTLAGTKIHVSKLNYIVELTRPKLVFPTPGPAGEEDQAIAHLILPHIKYGDTVQIGMGGIPNTIGLELAAREDMKGGIKIHTEIATDCMAEMERTGVLTHVTACGCFGTKTLFDWLEKTDIVEFASVKEMLFPESIAKIPNLRSILGCMMMDLRGQIAGEGAGHMQYSGVGGQWDFLEGSSNGRLSGNGSTCFMTLHSTYTDKNGKLHSNIVLDLPEGTVVSSARYTPMYVVTEYGIADIYMKTIKKRVPALISIAHPDFREELKQQAIAAGLVSENDF